MGNMVGSGICRNAEVDHGRCGITVTQRLQNFSRVVNAELAAESLSVLEPTSEHGPLTRRH